MMTNFFMKAVVYIFHCFRHESPVSHNNFGCIIASAVNYSKDTHDICVTATSPVTAVNVHSS